MSDFASALAHAQRGEFDAAAAKLAALVKREPNNANAHHLYANVLHAKGDVEAALAQFHAAAKLAPHDAMLAFNQAAALAAGKRHAEAIEAFDRALAANPNDAEAHFARGASLAALQRYADALAAYDAARAAGLTDRPQLYANRGAVLAALKRYDEAIEACDRALAANADNVETHFNRGAALLALDRPEEAVAALSEALTRAPDHALARANRAPALANLGRFDEAFADIEAAIAAQPDRQEHITRRAYVYVAANRRAEALADYETLLAATPDDAEALYGKADALLAAGDFERGLEAYEARLARDKIKLAPPADAPVWNGEDLAGKTLLVQGEQGFGDLFQFCRFYAELARRGARVILQERPQTFGLMRSVEGLAECVPYNAPPPPCDYRIYNASLMRALGLRLDTIPAPIPYLHADPARVAHWRERLRPTQRRRIGICWGGLGGSAMQRARRLDRTTLERLLGADADFVSLQFKAEEEAPLLAAHDVQHFGADTRDFAELAALIETLDLVISIDTNVAHIAGALGKPLWILLPFTPDWRWLNDRADTPWYPQARLFRQQRWGDWGAVADDVLAALQ